MASNLTNLNNFHSVGAVDRVRKIQLSENLSKKLSDPRGNISTGQQFISIIFY